jgi:hypothetical protein
MLYRLIAAAYREWPIMVRVENYLCFDLYPHYQVLRLLDIIFPLIYRHLSGPY